jgi:hypothetical protein
MNLGGLQGPYRVILSNLQTPCKHPVNTPANTLLTLCVCVSPIPHRRRGGCSTLTANHSYPRMKSRHLMGLRSSNDLPVHGL